jgi:serine/threonine-protein kinase
LGAKVVLKVAEGPIQGQEFVFEEHDVFIFGRASDCHAQLPDTDLTASRHHFVLEIIPPIVRVRDLGSRNGTYVNGVKCGGRPEGETPEQGAKRKWPQIDLKDRDTISVGKTSFVVQVSAPALCCDCGRLIPDAQRKTCAWVAGTFICPSCRQKAAKPGTPNTPPQPPRCARCGGKLGGGTAPGRPADHSCESCQSQLHDDPSELLHQILGGRAGGKKPRENVIPGYTLGKLLGRGGMGAVYLGTRERDRATVAVKVMLSEVAINETARASFRREIEVIKSLKHPNCVELFDHGSVGDGFFFAMEFCAGGNVLDFVGRQGGKLQPKLAVRIMLQALDGLAHAHRKGFVHRDIKPPNILLTNARDGVAKLSDFGLAKSFQQAGFSGMTVTGRYAGTFPFMPREQLTNFKLVKPVSDVWSAGATLYFLLTGQVPRDLGPDDDPLDVILSGKVVPVRRRDPSIPKGLADVVDRAVRDKTADRFQTADEFRKALAAAS